MTDYTAILTEAYTADFTWDEEDLCDLIDRLATALSTAQGEVEAKTKALQDWRPAYDNLRSCQRQLDQDGAEVGVSRQALEEVLDALNNRSPGPIEEIYAERRRQIDSEGYTPNHDDEHAGGQLAEAAAAYALSAAGVARVMDAEFEVWPWGSDGSFKPSDDPRRNLIRAGALIIAEIERLDRSALPTPPQGGDGT